MKLSFSVVVSMIFMVLCTYFTVADAKEFLVTHNGFNFFMMVLSGYLAYWNGKVVINALTAKSQ